MFFCVYAILSFLVEAWTAMGDDEVVLCVAVHGQREEEWEHGLNPSDIIKSLKMLLSLGFPSSHQQRRELETRPYVQERSDESESDRYGIELKGVDSVRNKWRRILDWKSGLEYLRFRNHLHGEGFDVATTSGSVGK
ncbi:hypothetical protein L1987_47399 [Smallanthus sonchifolius]|uniref:Uncharacterized protein n=1 Tax=Smallanthus sonchifolius TaxID=185202 RepID=A0ACB9G233_9ASTR|nr:hypothetical protein L1987_47399 [Smallanthus sonchifolius]